MRGRTPSTEADKTGRAMTPGALQRVLGLSSGATTAVIDRLEGLDHAHRDRDTVDRRRVHLRYGEGARALGARYFGPLGAGVSAVLDGFTDAELAVVERFLSEVDGVRRDAARRRTVARTPPLS